MDVLLESKIGALCVMLVLAFLAGLLPIKIRSLLMSSTVIPEKYTLIFLSSSLCFGAGVLMATVFMHILKETRESFNNAVERGIVGETEYAIPELLMCSGFFLIYFLEELVHLWVHHSNEQCNDTDVGHEHQQFTRVSSIRLRTSLRRCKSLESLKCCDSLNRPSNNNLQTCMIKSNEVTTDKYIDSSISNNNCTIDISKTKDLQKAPQEKVPEMTSMDESVIRTVLVILALSLHGTFEGLSLGLERNDQDVWLLCVALSSHKIFIAFSIGMELLEEGINLYLFVFHMAIFSLASPVGGVIGMTLTASLSDTSAGVIIITVLQGISGGTILYVTFCEVLERERTKATGRFIRLIALIAGFSVMAGLEAGVAEPNHTENSTVNLTQNISIADIYSFNVL